MKKIIAIVSAVVLLSLLLLSCSNIFLMPVFYGNSHAVERADNLQIKQLVLSALKDRYSYIEADPKTLYDEEHTDKIIQLDSPETDKRLFLMIDHGFMHTLEKYDDTTYILRVEMNDPTARYHEFKVAQTDEGYVITSWGIDL